VLKGKIIPSLKKQKNKSIMEKNNNKIIIPTKFGKGVLATHPVSQIKGESG